MHNDILQFESQERDINPNDYGRTEELATILSGYADTSALDAILDNYQPTRAPVGSQYEHQPSQGSVARPSTYAADQYLVSVSLGKILCRMELMSIPESRGPVVHKLRLYVSTILPIASVNSRHVPTAAAIRRGAFSAIWLGTRLSHGSL